MARTTPSHDPLHGGHSDDHREDDPHRDHSHAGHPHAHEGAHPHADDIPGLPHVPHASFGKLLLCFWIVAVFMVVEIVCGWLFGSLTLVSDGFHMLSDALSLGLAALAVRLSARKATTERTYGFKRLEILAAFGNGLTLLLLAIFITFQAIHRLLDPIPVEAKSLFWVASLGLLVNIFVLWWLHRGEDEKTLNEQGALWHVMGDLGASLAAMAAAVAILYKGWVWMDPALSLAIALVIAFGGFRVMKASGHILIEGTPEGVKVESVRKAMLARAQVRGVHDLHIWTLNGRDLYLSAHVDINAGDLTERQVMADLHQSLDHDFQVDHITLQMGHCDEGECRNDCEGWANAPASGTDQRKD